MLNIQEFGAGVTLPVPIADGGTGSTSAADARTALGAAATSHTHAIADVTSLQASLDAKAASSHTHAQSDVTGLVAALSGKADTSHTHVAANVTDLGTAATKNTGTTSGTVPLIGVGDKLPSAIIPPSTVDKVALWSAGTVTYYSTLAAAQAAAASGDVIIGYDMFNEAGLGKNGVSYYFPPGCGIYRTLDTTTPTFTDGGSTMEFSVAGYGDFVNDYPNQSSPVFSITGAGSKMGIVARLLKHTGVGSAVDASGNACEVYMDVDRTECVSAAINISMGSLWGELNTVISTTNTGIWMGGSSTAECYLDIDTITSGFFAIWCTNSLGKVYVHAKKIRTTINGNNSNAINVSAGEVHVDVLGECLAENRPAVKMTGGTLYIEGRMKTNQANASACLVGPGTLKIEAGSQLIANGSGFAVASNSGARDVILNGNVVSNAAVSSDITIRVGSLTTDSTYVS